LRLEIAMSSSRPFDELRGGGVAESFSTSDSQMLLKDDAPGHAPVSTEAGASIAHGHPGAARGRPINTPEDEPALRNILSAYAACGALWLVFASAVGLLMSLKLSYPELGTLPALSFGRLRPIHTNAAFFAWAAPALIGLALYIGARTSGTRLFSTRAAWLGLVLLNVAAVCGTVALDLGINNGDQEYREWPIWTQLILVAALLISAWNLIATIAHREEKRVYLSNWYTIGGLLWMVVVAVVAILPWYQRGLGQVSVQGYFMHNAVGLFFTPLCLGMLYYALPKVLGRPIHSYALGILAFWTNLIFYPIIGAHHFIFSPLPWWLQTTAIVFSVAMLIPVWAGSSNFFLSMRGTSERMHRAAVFILIGVLGYLLGSTQGTVEAFRSLQAIWHFSQFTIGHSHLTMFGFVTFAAWGGIYALLPRATGKAPSAWGVETHLWLATVGLVIYVLAMSVGGTVQGLDWLQGAPFIKSVIDMAPYWLWRSIGGLFMLVANVVFAWNVWTMTYGRSRVLAPVAVALRDAS
jgi:cytochrome c oxidase cbb3-type subunit 1